MFNKKKKTIEGYGDPHLHYYCQSGMKCNTCAPSLDLYDSEYARIPRMINPASSAATEYKACCGNGPIIGCINEKYTCLKNGYPYDPKVNLVIPPYSYPYEMGTTDDKGGMCNEQLNKPTCNRGVLNCKK